MPRTKESTRLNSRTSRADLEARREPYWLVLEKGRALGYRKGAKGGTWIARYYNPAGVPPMTYQALGAADDTSDADGGMVLSFAQAQAAARNWFETAYHQATGERVKVGPYTIADAVQDYIADRKRNQAKTADRMAYDFNARVIPSLGTIPLDRLTRKRLELWMDDVAAAPARYRGKEAPLPTTPDQIRARRATVNRLWKNLKAALNLAYREHRVQSNQAWKEVKEFRGTRSARVRFLTPAEQVRLVNSCPSTDFRRLVQAGLFTGARESELARLQAKDFDPVNGSVFIEFSKSNKARHITLTEEAMAFFQERVAGAKPDTLLFQRETYDRKQKDPKGTWSRAELSRTMAEACEAAGLEPLVFHELRHTYASGLVNRGVPLVFVAMQLGHRDTSMVELHYGHLCQNAKADAVRKLAPVLGIHQPSGIAALKVQGG
jgi:integrase